jgi:chemotaxis protein methyltransferase CheR
MTLQNHYTSPISPAIEGEMETGCHAGSTPPPKLSDRMFRQFSEYITQELGIKMPPTKKTMLQGRLQKRLRILGFHSFEDYAGYVFGPEGKATEESVVLMDLVTTNKTDFFREPRHFDYLIDTAVPALINAKGAGMRRKLLVWSAGCSTGAEPYTLAMVLSDFADTMDGFDFSILATDISTKVLEKAQKAVYREHEAEPVPLELKRRHLLKSRDRSARLVRVAPALRDKVRFRRLNFMEEDFGIEQPADIIFCRNVIIYFDQKTQERVLTRICRHLKPGGFLFMGHSETLHGLNLPLVQETTAIYKRKADNSTVRNN